MSLAQIAQAYHGDGTLLRRVEGACLHLAAYIIATESPAASNHAARVAWANAVQADATAEGRKLLVAVLANGDVEANTDGVADSTIQYVVEVTVNNTVLDA